MNRIALLLPALLLALLPPAEADPKRSRTLRAEFQRTSPCPSTGKPRGACHGYQVDHRLALYCGGRDDLTNLQWLSVREHQAKTKRDMRECRFSYRP